MKPDAHAGEDGRYTVRSVYFDDHSDSCYYDNEDGVNNRKKFRIRLYNGDPEVILLECKQKVNGRNHKEYERTPFIYKTGNVRVTFDRNIRATSKTRKFLEPVLCARPVMQKGMQLLEVKYDELLPDYIYSQLQLNDLQLTANSKYYAARRMTKDFCI